MKSYLRKCMIVIALLMFGLRVASSQAVLIASAPPQIVKYDVYEITFEWDSARYENVWMQVDLNVNFTIPSGEIVTIEGFFYEPNVWKARFAPSETGLYTWNASLNDASGDATATGEVEVTDSDASGFLRVSDDNPMRWEHDDGSAFHPLGIQDCLLDVNNDGNPINDWGLDGEVRPPGQHLPGTFSDIDTYFSTYAAAGFNLLRWSINNCSFNLYERVGVSEIRIDSQAGKWGDELLQNARAHGFRVYMGIFGVQPPFLNDTRERRMNSVRHAVDYTVARYGAYVDVWELMNEARPETRTGDAWYEIVVERLGNIDPYAHPISTSWERPDLTYIDVISPHWYASESPADSVVAMTDQITSARAQAENYAPSRPIMFGEIGNQDVNWDIDSARRLRIRTWTAFFNEASLIFWNSSFAKDYAVQGAANVYLGPEERIYTRVIQDYAALFPSDTIMTPVDVVAAPISAFGLSAPERFGVYVVNNETHETPTENAQITVDVPFAGTGIWLDPSTGSELARAPIDVGIQIIDVPPFVADVALLVMP